MGKMADIRRAASTSRRVQDGLRAATIELSGAGPTRPSVKERGLERVVCAEVGLLAAEGTTPPLLARRRLRGLAPSDNMSARREGAVARR